MIKFGPIAFAFLLTTVIFLHKKEEKKIIKPQRLPEVEEVVFVINIGSKIVLDSSKITLFNGQIRRLP